MAAITKILFRIMCMYRIYASIYRQEFIFGIMSWIYHMVNRYFTMLFYFMQNARQRVHYTTFSLVVCDGMLSEDLICILPVLTRNNMPCIFKHFWCVLEWWQTVIGNWINFDLFRTPSFSTTIPWLVATCTDDVYSSVIII